VTRASRLVTSAGIAAVGAAAILLARDIASRHVPGDPGPRAFPIAAAGLVVAGAVLALVADLRDRQAEPVKPARASAVVGAATLAYLLLLPAAGFVTATALLLGGASLYLDPNRRSPVVAHLVVAVATSVLSWFVFGRLLDVVLPAGPWGF
jgi:hypothetical protein